VEEARLSSKNQIVIPKKVRDELGLRQGDKVRFEILKGRRAVLQAAAPAPGDIFVRAGRGIVEEVLGEAKKVDEVKIRNLLRSLGVND
jgi:AbrB family looped-hinge helix DNA binding protein